MLVLGIAGAFYLKASNPARYEKIGRMIYEGFPEGGDGAMHSGEVAGGALGRPTV